MKQRRDRDDRRGPHREARRLKTIAARWVREFFLDPEFPLVADGRVKRQAHAAAVGYWTTHDQEVECSLMAPAESTDGDVQERSCTDNVALLYEYVSSERCIERRMDFRSRGWMTTGHHV